VVEPRGSYRLQEHFADVAAELARLEAQAAGFWGRESAVLRRRGLALDARVLEVGCGPGFVTERLLGLVPRGFVVGIDNDPYMVELAGRRLAGLERVEVRLGSVSEPGFVGAEFDAATARLIVQHLPDPLGALAEIRRVLRPGGRLFVTDIDSEWGLLLDPEPDHFEEVSAAVGSLRRGRGGDPRIGRRLPGLLTEAGFTDLALDVIAIHSVVDGPESLAGMLPAVSTLEPLVEDKLLTREAFESLSEFEMRFHAGELQVDGMFGLLVVTGTTA
jgi:ubiquinone/menaquinone biosynthesis C-methylase UbiE